MIATRGEVSAVAAGKSRVLQRNSAVMRGDVIKTGSGAARLRLSDNSVIALNPHSTFIVNNYRYQPKQPKSNRFIAKLLGGKLRTTTGAIAKLNRAGYRMEVGKKNKKPVAVIGVRGTSYLVNYNTPGSLTITVTSGTLLVNDRIVQMGQSIRFDAASANGRITIGTLDNSISEFIDVDESQLSDETANAEEVSEEASIEADNGEAADTGGLSGAPYGQPLGSAPEVVVPDGSGGGTPLSISMGDFTSISEPAAVAGGGEAMTSSIDMSGNIMTASH